MKIELAKLDSKLVDQICEHLGVERRSPSLEYVTELLTAYIRNVPWESASRNMRHGRGRYDPCWPPEFWQMAIKYGTGGTCFETNYAFFAFLSALGFEGYLTINDMNLTCGCHTAEVIIIDRQKWLIDPGYPLHVPLPIHTDCPATVESPIHDFTITPNGDGTYEISRNRHPKPYIFNFIDIPVHEEGYRNATTADYRPGGHFNDTVVINKIIDGRAWRFSENDEFTLESFVPDAGAEFGAKRLLVPPVSDDVSERAAQISQYFVIDRWVLDEAFAYVLDYRS